MPNLLKKIATRTKAIMKRDRSTYKAANKKAWSEYRSGKSIAGVKKKRKTTTRRKRRSGSKIRRKKIGSVRNNVDRVDRKKTSITIAGVGYHKSQLRIGLKGKLEKKAGQRELATRKTVKRKLSKDIAKIKKDIRALC
jgi:hypothetical protein